MLLIAVLTLVSFTVSHDSSPQGIHIIALRGNSNDASERFIRSADVFHYDYHIVDMGSNNDNLQDIKNEVKLAAVKKHLDTISEKDFEYVAVLDSHTSLLLTDPVHLLQIAEQISSEFIFASKDDSSVVKYPDGSLIFSGMLAKTVYLKSVIPDLPEILTSGYFDSFTKSLVGIQEELKTTAKLDTDSKLFQVLPTDTSSIKIRFQNDRGYIQNVHKDSIPAIAISDESSKIKLNSLSNYLVRAWSPETGCQICSEDSLDLNNTSKSTYPIVQLSIFVAQPTPFLELFFQKIVNLTYPKQRIHLTTHCAVPEQKKELDKFIDQHKHEYRSFMEIDEKNSHQDITAFNLATSMCIEKDECSSMFYVEATAHYNTEHSLEHLVSASRSIIAPMMLRRGKYWSTFWGAINENGDYARSDDYFEIVEHQKVGLWNVPMVGTSFLISRWALKQLHNSYPTNTQFHLAFALTAIKKNVFMYVDNREDFGILINPTTFNVSHVHGDLWQLYENSDEWEEQYIHPGYKKLVAEAKTKDDFEQPCTDIFWIPLMSEKFCEHLLDEVTNYGIWSDGSNYDPRLEGGYENVPTRDIHMRQIDWESQWIYVLRKYVYPIQIKLFDGYYDKPWARMNFIVRYKQGEQPSLRYHHDASTYTLDMALNRAHIDYEGGGVHFSRYNCTLVDTRVGWPLIFPGRLTHIHEGLETTKGIRYIFVTFVNP